MARARHRAAITQSSKAVVYTDPLSLLLPLVALSQPKIIISFQENKINKLAWRTND